MIVSRVVVWAATGSTAQRATVANGSPAPASVAGSGSAPQNPTQAPSPGAPAANIGSGNGNIGAGNSNNNVHRLLAVVDPAHGGDERGAALTDTLPEKNVTLGFARLLRHELEIRGFAVALLRDGDNSSTLDQRAAAANAARAGIYISLHAASQGNGARVYTALLPVEGINNGVFHAWNAAQASALPVSRMVSAAIVAEIQKKQLPVRESSASLRQLKNVVILTAAVALRPVTDLSAGL